MSFPAHGGHADLWQVCLAHQLRDCRFAIEAGDAAFARRMKALLLRAVPLARRRKTLVASTRQQYRKASRPRPRRHHGAQPIALCLEPLQTVRELLSAGCRGAARQGDTGSRPFLV